MHEQDTQEIEIQMDHAKQHIAFGDAIERLIRNKDFQTVIDQGYTTDEARRLTLLMGDPTIENKAPIVASLQAIGELHQFLRFRRGFADQMRKELADAQQYLDEVAEAESESVEVEA